MQSEHDVRFILGVVVGLGLGLLLPRISQLYSRDEAPATRIALADAKESDDVVDGGLVYKALCRCLHGTDCSPFQGIQHLLPPQDHSYGHTNVPLEFLKHLFRRLQPSFLVEVGSFKGGSALRIAEAALEALPAVADAKPCLVCVDTFLGDAGMWLDHNPGWRDWLMLHHGMPQLYWQFMANVKSLRDIILPLPLASMCALRALQRLAVKEEVPLPDFIYLDSAHEKGETLLEITQAMNLLKAGGILLGDDLDWPAVESDVHDFLTGPGANMITGADDSLLAELPELNFCSSPSPGYWIVDSVPRQWLLRKREDAADLEGLQNFLGTQENGSLPAEYVPLTDADRAALTLYHEAVALSEAGKMKEAIRLFKQAAQTSASVEFHFKL